MNVNSFMPFKYNVTFTKQIFMNSQLCNKFLWASPALNFIQIGQKSQEICAIFTYTTTRSMPFTTLIIVELELPGQLSVKNLYTEFLKNPTNGA
jgi:hypothetical protein